MVVVDPVMVAKSGDVLARRGRRSRDAARSCCRARSSSRRTSPKPRSSAGSSDSHRSTMRARRRGGSSACGRGGRRQGRARGRRRDRRPAVRRRAASPSCRRRASTRGTRTAPAARSRRRSPRHLALGHSLADATARAQAYVAGAIRHGLAIGKGHGPLDHFWQMRQPKAAALALGPNPALDLSARACRLVRPRILKG